MNCNTWVTCQHTAGERIVERKNLTFCFCRGGGGGGGGGGGCLCLPWDLSSRGLPRRGKEIWGLSSQSECPVSVLHVYNWNEVQTYIGCWDPEEALIGPSLG